MNQNGEPDPYVVLQVTRNAHQTVIRAAYRALAALYHPDTNSLPGAEQRMAQLNAAYAQVGTPEHRARYDHLHGNGGAALRAPTAQAAAGQAAARPSGAGGVLDFGRYQGWTIADLARQDPDYLRWLARHSSGIRYRHEIEERLKASDARERLRATGPGTAEPQRGRRS